MKLTTAAVLASCAPSLGFALVGIAWSITNVPGSGLTDITFPFSIANAPRKNGYYFAQQFSFNGQSDVGYTGLQPRPDANGRPVIHAFFSSSVAGTTTIDKNCSHGADGGQGVSCAIEFNAPYANSYELEIRMTQGTTWQGTVVNTTTGRRVLIGTWTLPAGTGGIKGSETGFMEYFPWNDGRPHSCNTLPNTSVVFGIPTTTTKGVTGGLRDAYEYGNCVGKVAFKSQRTSNRGVEISVGF
ncbi:hypothetical protein KVV02_006765 [Mortierella alpina]|uniref:Uncharacterized protein n=1 Tax=Mortierella alpina TaxID=64518 RepID=A0A9P8CY19_MORAP|nr:hypothetical protein KVV02_006765 [Mortierella alpina]